MCAHESDPHWARQSAQGPEVEEHTWVQKKGVGNKTRWKMWQLQTWGPHIFGDAIYGMLLIHATSLPLAYWQSGVYLNFTCTCSMPELALTLLLNPFTPFLSYSPPICRAEGDLPDGSHKLSPNSESSLETHKTCGEQLFCTHITPTTHAHGPTAQSVPAESLTFTKS